MTPATIQALRRLLFFSAPEAAELIGGVTERSWRFWETGERPVPADVIEKVTSLVRWREKAIAEYAATMSADKPAIVWYSTMADWLSLDGREKAAWRPYCSVVAELCASRGAVAIEFLGADYVTWLGRRKDSEASRRAWAAVQAFISERNIENSQNSV